MTGPAEVSDADFRQLSFIREETRFEIVLLHERVNALIGAEAFLTIAFTAAMSNANPHWGTTFSVLVSPLLALTGFLLAALAWPGVNASFKIIVQWDARQLQLFQNRPALVGSLWRPHPQTRRDLDQRTTMLFARAVPLVFTVAWAALMVIALVLPRQ
jgi:hypothetical protein